MKKRFIIIALTLLSLNAHAQKYNYDVNNDGQVNVSDIMLIVNKILGKENDEPKYPINVSVTQKPFADNDANASGIMRSPVTTTESLAQDPGKFYVDCSYFSRRDAYNAGTGTYEIGSPEYMTHWVESTGTSSGHWVVGTVDNSGEGNWPANVDLDNDRIPFYAYANYEPGHFGFEGFQEYSVNETVVSKPYLHFVVEENSGAQKDLLVAKTADSYRREGKKDGFLSFTFDHACTAVQFFITKSEKLTNANVIITVKGVELHNVYNEGYYYYRGKDGSGSNEEWADLKYYKNEPAVYTISDNSTEIAVPNQNSYFQLSTEEDKVNNYLFMIPQTTTPWYTNKDISSTSGAYIKLADCSIVDANQKTYKGSAYIPFSVTWQKGYKQKAVIIIGTGLRNANGERIFDSNGNLVKFTVE